MAAFCGQAAARAMPVSNVSLLSLSMRGLNTSAIRPRSSLLQLASKRTSSARQASTVVPIRPKAGYSSAEWRKIGVTVGGVVVAGAAITAFMNRETRQGGLDLYERAHLHSTFQYAGAGLAIVAVTAVGLHRAGWSVRLMRTNQWLVIGGSLALTIGSMMGVYNTAPNTPAHLACWALFNASMAATLSPMLFLAPALLGRAALYTAGLMGGLCYTAATAKNDTFLYMGGALMAGLVVVALSSLAPLLLPATALGALQITEAVSLYGGLAVFGGFTLYDTQKILAHARNAKITRAVLDPAAESISLVLDFINIFVRMVSILSGSRRK